MTALRRHIYLEEEFVFPPLRASGMFAPVLVMLAEHRELWRTMAELESGLDEGSTPTELVALARTLLAQLERHNSKEEPIVYPQADVVLDADARERLLDFLDNGAVPAGWACPGA
jgi:iron-sulfur cluster repair protein YtfE (RIC family)